MLGWGLRAAGHLDLTVTSPVTPWRQCQGLAVLRARTSAPIPLVLPIQRLSSHTPQLPASPDAPACPQAPPACFRCLTPVDTPRVRTPSASLAPLSCLALGVSGHLPSAIHALSCPRHLWSVGSPLLFSLWGPYPPRSLSYCLCDRDFCKLTCLTFFLPPSCHLPWRILIHFKVDEPVLELLSSP